MKKQLFTAFVLLFFSAAGVWAQDAAQRLVVWQVNGEKTLFDLTDQPETTFEEGKLVIKTSSSTVYYQQANVLRYTYDGPMTAIESVTLQPGEIRYTQGSDELCFDGLADGTQLTVYALDGKQIFSQKAVGGQCSVVSLAALPAGSYIVKVNQATFKFSKR